MKVKDKQGDESEITITKSGDNKVGYILTVKDKDSNQDIALKKEELECVYKLIKKIIKS